ncbi:MAG: trypsin-like peptidase domain-containing protein [Deltaproteobacteria bacterium]|nr:trypsin-like peptidase domain-containing protein [Deltaproteobacteria bacterium]
MLVPTTLTCRLLPAATLLAGLAVLVGCAQDVGEQGPDVDAALDAAHDDKAVIVGGVDWQEAAALPEGSAERAVSRAVAYLSIPAEGARCTGFLVAPDVIMTNQHCIPTAASAAGVRALFRYEEGGPADDAGVDCSEFLGNDAGLDFALLRCSSRPGDQYGVVALEATTPSRNAGVYVIHQNCDYYTSPECAPTKKYSPGRVTSTMSEIGHDADTLGGSSGSPLFSRVTHGVVGLHHVGLGNDGAGRGSENRAVPMSAILPVLTQRYPGVLLGARAPTDQSAPAPTAADGYEPNNLRADATAVQLPFTSVDARIDTADQDHFRFTAAGARTIRLAFSHHAGDLDLYLLDEAGAVLARSIGTTDVEEIALEASATVVIRVIGYRGATGSYALDVR